VTSKQAGIGPEDLMTSGQFAAYIGMSESWLTKERAAGRGPRYLKIGGLIRYRKSFGDEYLQSCIRDTEESRRSAA